MTISYRDEPSYHGYKTLPFDNATSDELELPPERRAGYFLSRYQSHIDPIRRYPKYFSGMYGSVDTIFRKIKEWHVKSVGEGLVTELQLIDILDEAFTKRYILSDKNLHLGIRSVKSGARKRLTRASSDKSTGRKRKRL